MNKRSKIVYLILSVVFFIVLNRYFSLLILNDLRFKITENSLFDLILVQNTGAAFSILENSKMFLIIFSVIAIFMILIYAFRNVEKFSTLAAFWLSMLISGIVCNLYERITLGYVQDFFKLNFIDFPVFNISDVFINIGVLALIIIIVKNKYLKNENNN